MNRRTAMLTSAGIVLAMLVAGLAMTMGLTGPSADAQTVARRSAPRVRTTTETVTIHRKADALPAEQASLRVVQAAAPATATSSFGEDEGWDDEGEDEESEDSYESQEFEAEDDSPDASGGSNDDED